MKSVESVPSRKRVGGWEKFVKEVGFEPAVKEQWMVRVGSQRREKMDKARTIRIHIQLFTQLILGTLQN